ncbi:phage tail protein [Citrobacter sp. RHBSTW-00944]|uniref:phage tail protein n=1 Tax=Citrobacter sp. RHBSTW-00944 TaxID=2742671 RepID=UPI0015E4BF89|nr:phage tail protein [Citrobacter sp. RHBSTW-00944]QLO82473.1 phage tail protein [Citrobacter sp. RHBSTW-00944]
MATKYFALLTNIGAAKLANATALGAQVEITQMAVGDGNGVLPTPNPAQTALTHELRRAQLNMLTIDPVNTNQIIAEQVIPEDAGGWWIREIGLFDKDGDMIAVANCAETYKPQLQEGSGRVQVIRVILIVSSTEAVTLKIDPSVVLATRKYVDDAVIEVKAYADDVMKKHVAAANPHKQYPLIANALKEMVDAGLVNQILENLHLEELPNFAKYGAPMIGELIEWPSDKMPNEIYPDMKMEFIPYIGQSFDPVKYPLLATLHPNLHLPADMRANVARGWDWGRGIDAGRVLMSAQDDAMQRITGELTDMCSGDSLQATGALTITAKPAQHWYAAATVSSAYLYYRAIGFDNASVARTANENRMKNVAWNMIVRAK